MSSLKDSNSLQPIDYDGFLRSHRKKPLFQIDDLPSPLSLGQDGIKKIIPHRTPLLLVDSLLGIDIETGLIAGRRSMQTDDPVFKGHFPEYPVYPGTLAVEMIGQISLCLYYFITNQTVQVSDDPSPPPVRATRILGAYFLEPIRPGNTVTLLAMRMEYDGFMARAVGQAIVDNKISCVTAGEVYFLD